MATRSQSYKIIAIVILFLVFLQYLYLYPVKLNLGFSSNHITNTPPFSSPSSSFSTSEKSLFNFKTGAVNKKRSPELGGNSDALSSETREQGNSNSANNYNHAKKEDAFRYQNYVRLKLVSSTTSTTSSPRISSSASSNMLPTSKSLHNNNVTENLNQSKLVGIASSPSVSPTSLPLCPTKPPTLLGYLKVALSQPPSLADIGRSHDDIALGGHYKPPNCTSKDKVAIIVPFRDREEHLRLFLVNILPFIKRQKIEFNIFVIEQGGASDELFNRAMLFNVGFAEANKRGKFDCFIFHDVDLIPENDYNLYNCPVQPRHMSVAVDKMDYKLPYRNLFGGICALTGAHFQKVNGFSNSFWGWGAEDDDMSGRIAYNGLYISRPPPNIARYKMLKHKQQKLNTLRYRVLQKGKTRFRSDGLSNLKYSVEQVVLEKTYTLVRVKLEKP